MSNDYQKQDYLNEINMLEASYSAACIRSDWKDAEYKLNKWLDYIGEEHGKKWNLVGLPLDQILELVCDNYTKVGPYGLDFN